MNICVFGAASKRIGGSYIEAGEKLGVVLAKRGHKVIYGGGASGMMGATARGVYSEKGELCSVVPKFFNVDGILFEHNTEEHFTVDMRERKRLLEDKCDAFIVTPGGIGTLDEFFEVITLRNLHRHEKKIALLNTNGFFDGLISWLDKCSDEGFLGKDVFDLIFVSDSIDEVMRYIEG